MKSLILGFGVSGRAVAEFFEKRNIQYRIYEDHINDLHKENFDIIIDDAMHELHYNRIFFENSIHKLKVGGVYIIEDIMDYSMGEYYEQMEKWMERFPNYDFRMYPVEDAWVWNNCLMMIKRID